MSPAVRKESLSILGSSVQGPVLLAGCGFQACPQRCEKDVPCNRKAFPPEPTFATSASCKEWRAAAYAVGMPKKPPKQVEIPKVVPMTEEKRQVIATDQKSQRVIIGIGQQRIAFDLFRRVTRLPPHTGDQPAPVVTMKKKEK